MKEKSVVGLSLLGICWGFPALAHACSVCLTGANDPTADGFNWSVFFLMAAPYTVVGSIAGWLFHSYRRSVAREKTQEENRDAERLSNLALRAEESAR
jgi:hypothetical protein